MLAPLCLCLPLLLSGRYQLLLERAGLGIVGPSGKKPGLRGLVDGRPGPGRRARLRVIPLNNLLFERRLAILVVDLTACNSGTLRTNEPSTVGGIGGIGNVREGGTPSGHG